MAAIVEHRPTADTVDRNAIDEVNGWISHESSNVTMKKAQLRIDDAWEP